MSTTCRYAKPSKEAALIHPIPYGQFHPMVLESARAYAERDFYNFGTADDEPWLNHMLALIVSLGTYRLTEQELDRITEEAVAEYHATLSELKAMPEAAE